MKSFKEFLNEGSTTNENLSSSTKKGYIQQFFNDIKSVSSKGYKIAQENDGAIFITFNEMEEGKHVRLQISPNSIELMD